MKLLLSTTLGLCLSALTILPVNAADKVCLKLNSITSSEPSKDGGAITFKTQDGKVWRNDLQTKCSDLLFNGFVWTVQSPEEICDNEMSLRVLQSGQVCQLGKFTQVTPAPKT